MENTVKKMNQIAGIKTQEIEDEGQVLHAIMCSVKMSEPSELESFLPEVVNAVKMQRTISDPHTSLLCVSVLGDFDPEHFAEEWRKRVAVDDIMKMYMLQMDAADVLHGTPEGKIIGKASLI